jgi:hypothetical protein
MTEDSPVGGGDDDDEDDDQDDPYHPRSSSLRRPHPIITSPQRSSLGLTPPFSPWRHQQPPGPMRINSVDGNRSDDDDEMMMIMMVMMTPSAMIITSAIPVKHHPSLSL